MAHYRFYFWPAITAVIAFAAAALTFCWSPVAAAIKYACDVAFPSALAATGERLALVGDVGSAGLTLNRVRAFRDSLLQRSMSRRRSAPLNVGSVGAGLCFGC